MCRRVSAKLPPCDPAAAPIPVRVQLLARGIEGSRVACVETRESQQRCEAVHGRGRLRPAKLETFRGSAAEANAAEAEKGKGSPMKTLSAVVLIVVGGILWLVAATGCVSPAGYSRPGAAHHGSTPYGAGYDYTASPAPSRPVVIYSRDPRDFHHHGHGDWHRHAGQGDHYHHNGYITDSGGRSHDGVVYRPTREERSHYRLGRHQTDERTDLAHDQRHERRDVKSEQQAERQQLHRGQRSEAKAWKAARDAEQQAWIEAGKPDPKAWKKARAAEQKARKSHSKAEKKVLEKEQSAEKKDLKAAQKHEREDLLEHQLDERGEHHHRR